MDSREFEWESQLRFYWQQQPDELIVMQCTGEFGYGYEYMGLNGRLVITPLTDRIYLTITQVIYIYFAANICSLNAPTLIWSSIRQLKGQQNFTVFNNRHH